jgi:hypothetical protein
VLSELGAVHAVAQDHRRYRAGDTDLLHQPLSQHLGPRLPGLVVHLAHLAAMRHLALPAGVHGDDDDDDDGN